jgi:hypothetical protein
MIEGAKLSAYLVTEEIAARILMPQLELGSQRPEPRCTFLISAPSGSIRSTVSILFVDLDNKVVVGVSVKPFEAITANLLVRLG